MAQSFSLAYYCITLNRDYLDIIHEIVSGWKYEAEHQMPGDRSVASA